MPGFWAKKSPRGTAIPAGRKAVAVELKDSYFKQLVRNVENATRQTADLFSEPAA